MEPSTLYKSLILKELKLVDYLKSLEITKWTMSTRENIKLLLTKENPNHGTPSSFRK
jgi:hypothetical protein